MATQTIDLGNTNEVSFDGSQVCQIDLDGTTIWEGLRGNHYVFLGRGVFK